MLAMDPPPPPPTRPPPTRPTPTPPPHHPTRRDRRCVRRQCFECRMVAAPLTQQFSQTATEYERQYDSARGGDYSRFHGYAYDGIWAIASALHQVRVTSHLTPWSHCTRGEVWGFEFWCHILCWRITPFSPVVASMIYLPIVWLLAVNVWY